MHKRTSAQAGAVLRGCMPRSLWVCENASSAISGPDASIHKKLKPSRKLRGRGHTTRVPVPAWLWGAHDEGARDERARDEKGGGPEL